jgi:hypothetical protein
MNNIKIWYTWSFDGNPCGHAHRTFEAAERCGRSIVNAAQQGVEFSYPAHSTDILETLDAFGPEFTIAGGVKHHSGI